MSHLIKQLVVNKVIKLLPISGYLALGAGSTVNLLIERLEELNSELTFITNASSTSLYLQKKGLKQTSYLTDLIEFWMVDGADLIIIQNDKLIILKGQGGALVAEKILWEQAEKIIVAVDKSKLEAIKNWIIPIEIIPDSTQYVMNTINSMILSNFNLSLRTSPRMAMPFITDYGNYIIDLSIKSGEYDLIKLHLDIKRITGVIDTGIFSGDIVSKAEIWVGYEEDVKKYN